MYRYFFAPLLLSALALARPQTPADTSALAGLPACAQDAASSALASSGCAATDKNCICSSAPFLAAITTSVTQTCSAQDVQAALIFGQTFCGAAMSAGTSSSAPAAAGAAATSSASMPSASASDEDSYNASTTTVPATVSTATTSISGAMGSAMMSVSTVPGSAMTSMLASGVMMTTTTQCTTTTVMTTAAKTMGYANATFTGAAAKNTGQGMFAAFIGVAGAVALL